MYSRKNQGITLVALVITMVILLIITSISITGTIRGKKETEEGIEVTELNMVQHAILERYTKSKLTKEQLPGQEISKEELQEIIKEIEKETGKTIELRGNTNEYILLNEEGLNELQIEHYKSEYIVNYSTGEVIDITRKTTESGQLLYIYAIDNK